MKRSLVSTVIGIVIAVLASLLPAAPAGAADGDEIQRLKCFTAGDEHYRFQGCVGYVLNKQGKRVATGFADDAGAGEGYSPILVRVTNVRLQSTLCGATDWGTVHRRPDLDGWWARDYARTKGLSSSVRGVRYRAKADFAWKYRDGTNRHSRTVVSGAKDHC